MLCSQEAQGPYCYTFSDSSINFVTDLWSVAERLFVNKLGLVYRLGQSILIRLVWLAN